MNEIQLPGAVADANAKCVIRNASGLAWNGSAFVAYATADLDDYKVALAEQGTSSGYYVGDFPSAIATAGTYSLVVYDQSGATLVETDAIIGTGEIPWDGSAEEAPESGDDLTSLAYVKEYLNLSVTTYDSRLTTAIHAVSKAIVNYVGHGFKADDYVEYYDFDQPETALVLRQRPVTAVAQVTLFPYDTSPVVIDGANFYANGAGILRFKPSSTEGYGFPCGPSSVKVEYSAGYGTVPADVQEACAMAVGRLLYQGRRDPSLMQERIGDWAATYATSVQSVLMTADVRSILELYRERAGMSIENLMIHTVAIQTVTQAKNASGVQVYGSPNLKHASAPARVHDQTADRAQVLYGKYDVTKMKRVYFASDWSIVAGRDQIVWEGVAYDVTSVMNQGGNLNRLWAVDCVRQPY